MPKIIIAYERGFSGTPSRLVELSAQFRGNPFEAVRVEKCRPKGDDFVVVWGTSSLEGKLSTHPSRLILSNDKQMGKLTAYGRLEKADIPVPRFTDVSGTWSPFPKNGVLMRTRTGCKGAGIYFCPNKAALNEAIATKARDREDYMIAEFIPKVAEFRAIVIGGKAVSVVRKKATKDEYEKEVAWNYQDGKFVQVAIKNKLLVQTLGDLGAAAATAIGYNFIAAVDILMTPYRGYFVCDINAAPGVSEEKRLRVLFDHINAQANSAWQKQRS